MQPQSRESALGGHCMTDFSGSAFAFYREGSLFGDVRSVSLLQHFELLQTG